MNFKRVDVSSVDAHTENANGSLSTTITIVIKGTTQKSDVASAFVDYSASPVIVLFSADTRQKILSALSGI